MKRSLKKIGVFWEGGYIVESVRPTYQKADAFGGRSRQFSGLSDTNPTALDCRRGGYYFPDRSVDFCEDVVVVVLFFCFFFNIFLIMFLDLLILHAARMHKPSSNTWPKFRVSTYRKRRRTTCCRPRREGQGTYSSTFVSTRARQLKQADKIKICCRDSHHLRVFRFHFPPVVPLLFCHFEVDQAPSLATDRRLDIKLWRAGYVDTVNLRSHVHANHEDALTKAGSVRPAINNGSS